MSFVFLFVFILFFTFVLTAVSTRILLPILKRRHIGQKILEIGPSWHSAKDGTPTMGGLSFVIATALALTCGGALLSKTMPALFLRPLLFTGLYAGGNAIIGSIDDLTKFRKNQNEGLTPAQKLILQLSLAIAYLAVLRTYGYIDTSLYIPYINRVWELGAFYDLFAVPLLVGFVNFANLSDGIDGLAATLALIFGSFFAIAATYLKEGGALILSAALMGAALGFLMFNRHPARIFMGDTGSLFLGGMAVGCGFLVANPLLIVVVGGVYILEGLSVILQVAYYKATRKRLFRMAPLHHHLEKGGWGENRIVLCFALLAIFFALLAIPGIGGFDT